MPGQIKMPLKKNKNTWLSGSVLISVEVSRNIFQESLISICYQVTFLVVFPLWTGAVKNNIIIPLKKTTFG